MYSLPTLLPFCPGGIDYPEEYRGCFAETPTLRSLPDLLGASTAAMTPTICRNLARARAYRYYATQNGTLCFGGTVSPVSLGNAAGSCQTLCPGALNDRMFFGCIYAARYVLNRVEGWASDEARGVQNTNTQAQHAHTITARLPLQKVPCSTRN